MGLEISPTAVQEGKAYLSETLGEGSTGKAEVLLADFFTWCDPDGPFDIGFDYTVGTLGEGSNASSWLSWQPLTQCSLCRRANRGGASG